MQSNNFFGLEQIIDRQPLSVAPQTPLIQVIALMQAWGNSCNLTDSDASSATSMGANNSCVLVVEQNQLRGIFTERDLVKLIATGANTDNITVGEAMSQNVVALTATGSEDMFTALNLLRQHRIRHLPIVDDRQNLLGLITARNLRQKLQPINLMQWRKVSEIMKTGVVHAHPNDSVRLVAGLMADHQISCVAIAQSELDPQTNSSLVRPIGIITERDIVQFQNLNLDFGQPARNLMSTPLFLVSPEDTLWSVHQQMQHRRVRRLLAVGKRGELQGIITQTSLLEIFDPTEMYGVIDVLQQQVCQLEIERTRLLENRQAELENKIQQRTAALFATNQKLQQEASLRQQSQQRFDSILSSLEDVVYSIDPDTFEVFYLNSAAEKIYGRSVAAFYHKPHLYLEMVHPQDRDRVGHFAQNTIKAEVSEIEYRIIRPDGVVRWLYDRVRLIRNAEGIPIRLDGIVSDISDRKRREEILKDIASGISVEAGANFLPSLVEYLSKTLRVDYAYVGELIGPKKDCLKTLAVYSKGQIIDNFEYHLAGTPCKNVVEQHLCVYSKAVQQLFPDSPLLPKMRAESFAGMPIVDAAGTVGLIAIVDSKPFDDISLIEEVLKIFATRATTELERQQAEQKIRQQAALLDVATDAIIIRGLDAQILFWNQGAEKLYGWTKAEALNQDANQLLYREFFTQLGEIGQAVTEQGEWQGELNQVTKAGKDIVVQSRWTLVKDDRGLPQSYLVVNSDITEQKQLQAQFLRTQRLESLGTLAGGIAHDLNNILAPILGFARLLPLKLPNLDEQTRKYFNIIETNAERGAALVQQILTFARGIDGDRSMIQIRHLIVEIKQIIAETFPKTIELEINAPKNLWTINGDINQLHQVLMNLAVNARDAMPDGGKLTIKAENFVVDDKYARLHLDATVGSYILITVADTGLGISPKIIDRIFEPFFTTKEIGQGTGLGLSTVIGIVKKHGGFVDVASCISPRQRGTKIKVFLPASETAAIDAEEIEQIPQGNGELILVVDDETAILEATKATLEIYNYKVLTASNGIDAIAIYAQNHNAIDVVLTDIMMPSMNGKTLIRTLKKINPHIKIIVFSGLVSNREIIAELDGSIAAFINKPYTNDELLNTIDQVVNHYNDYRI